jgi:preprotein translocase subunit SecG
MTGRSTANLLSRATAILAALFMTLAVLLVVLRNRERAPPSIVDQGLPASPVAPLAPAPPGPRPAGPPAAPTAPLAR